MIVLAAACIGCGDDNPTRPAEPGWYSLGMPEHELNDLELAYPYLYLAAGDKGISRRRVDQVEGEWEYMGLAHAELADTSWGSRAHAYVSDLLALETGALLAGLTSYAEWFPGLYRSCDGGLNWDPSDTGIADTLCPFESNVSSLDGSPTHGELCFAGTEGAIYRSEDAGVTWTRLRGFICAGLGVHELQVHPRAPQIIWAVGEGNIFVDYIVASSDGGQTWRSIDLGDAAPGMLHVRRLCLDPSDEDVVYVWTWDDLIKSEDGGDTWAKASFSWAPGGVHRMVFDYTRPGHLFASADDIYESWDGGDTAEPLESPHATGVRDIEYDPLRGVLYLGTKTEVYKYLSP
jgi:photosystem II stability/assembly factor-like uncharacterized protein